MLKVLFLGGLVEFYGEGVLVPWKLILRASVSPNKCVLCGMKIQTGNEIILITKRKGKGIERYI